MDLRSNRITDTGAQARALKRQQNGQEVCRFQLSHDVFDEFYGGVDGFLVFVIFVLSFMMFFLDYYYGALVTSMVFFFCRTFRRRAARPWPMLCK